MENKEKLMTGEESLKIITDMINRTKLNIRQGMFHLLFWGWLIFVCSLSEYLLFKFKLFEQSYYIWLFVIPGVLVSLIYGFLNGRKQNVFTYGDRLYMWTWLGFMFTATILFIFLSDQLWNVSPFILLLAGYPTFISGIIIKFRPLMIGGITIWILSIVSHFAGPSVAPLAVPVAVLTGYLIPGYMLKKKVNHDSL